MANTFNVVDWLSQEALRQLVNKLQVAQFFNTSYNKEYTRSFAVGETVRVNFPYRFIPGQQNNLSYEPQPLTQRNTTVSIDQVSKVHFEWSDVEAALRLERGREKIAKDIIEPAMATIAQDIDSRAALWVKNNASNIVGVLGTDPTTFQVMTGAARQRLIELACPPSMEKGMVITPSINTSLVNAAMALFQPDDSISRQYKEGSIGRQGGFKWYESMSLYEHTAGVWQGAVTLASASATGDTSLAVTCTSGDTFKQGDKIGVASVYWVNPMTRRVTSRAQTVTFSVASDVTATTTSATVPITSTIYGPGSQYQNVSALPAQGAVLTLFPGTSSPNGKVGHVSMAIHPDAFALVAVPLEKPKAVEMSSQERDPDTGVTVRFVRAWDPQESKMTNRLECIFGFGNLYNDNCVVAVLGA